MKKEGKNMKEENNNEKEPIKLSLGTAAFIAVISIFLLMTVLVLISYVLV